METITFTEALAGLMMLMSMFSIIVSILSFFMANSRFKKEKTQEDTEVRSRVTNVEIQLATLSTRLEQSDKRREAQYERLSDKMEKTKTDLTKTTQDNQIKIMEMISELKSEIIKSHHGKNE